MSAALFSSHLQAEVVRGDVQLHQLASAALTNNTSQAACSANWARCAKSTRWIQVSSATGRVEATPKMFTPSHSRHRPDVGRSLDLPLRLRFAEQQPRCSLVSPVVPALTGFIEQYLEENEAFIRAHKKEARKPRWQRSSWPGWERRRRMR